MVNRIDKFKLLREENKRKATEWEKKYKEKTPEYERYSVMLVSHSLRYMIYVFIPSIFTFTMEDLS